MPSPSVPESDPQDAQWVGQVIAGQRDIYEQLVLKYQGLVYAVVLSYVRDAHRAEDLAQEVLVQAYVALPQLRSGGSFMPWLLQIARNRASRVARRAARRPEVGEDALETVASAPESGEDERIAEALGLVEALPEPMRQTVLLKYRQGLSCREIADREQVAVGTITSRLSRALIKLREAAKRSQ